jgi:choline dehydrogenase-like flavoprotein
VPIQAYDIITVGGGIAASAFASAMAQRGASVLILEQETRFRDRVRGEGTVPWGVAEAREPGLLELLCADCAHDVPFSERGRGRTTSGRQHLKVCRFLRSPSGDAGDATALPSPSCAFPEALMASANELQGNQSLVPI